MPMRTCRLRSLLKWPSRACAPSFGVASTALALLRLAGGRCAPRPSRASGSPGARRARGAFTKPRWMRGAPCAETTLHSRVTLRTWASWRS
eukprot:9619980-Alexandrium_andersonii.AAC.1